MEKSDFQYWLTDSMASFRANRKKTTILLALVVVLAMTGGRLLLPHHGTSEASANVESAPTSPFILDLPVMTEDPAKSASLNRLTRWAETPAVPPGRNLFQIDLSQYATDGSRPKSSGGATRDTFWHDLEKSMNDRADQDKQRQVLVDALKADAGNLKLQTTTGGSSPKAIVNGILVGEGDVVAKFRIVRIENRRITVEREGITFEVRMN
jgi:hypothetical protein